MKKGFSPWWLNSLMISGLLFLSGSSLALAAPQDALPIQLPDIKVGGEAVTSPKFMVVHFQLLLLMTLLTLAPYILVMMTSFIRISIVLSFIRTALGTQQVPPTQVLMGLALFMTIYIMAPIGNQINKDAMQPYAAGRISQQEFFKKAIPPIENFMLKQTRDKDLALFTGMAKLDLTNIKTKKDLPIYVVIPAFVLSEIKTAFEIGFIIYLPFLVIDMVVSSVLMAMGMFMMSPMSIALPFKLLLFVMIDGWNLIVNGLVKSFRM